MSNISYIYIDILSTISDIVSYIDVASKHQESHLRMPNRVDILRVIVLSQRMHPRLNRLCRLAVALGLLGSLSGCFLLLGEMAELAELRLLVGRAELAEAAPGLGLGLGGEALVATRVAQANLGAIIVSDRALGHLAVSGLRIEVGEGALAQSGRAVARRGGVEVSFGNKGDMFVSELRPRPGQTGLFSDHFASGRRISYSRLSPDLARIDYFVLDANSGTFRPTIYALRDPSGRSIAFFGRNHAYLGKAVYRLAAGGTGSGAAALAVGAVARIELNDFANTPGAEQCSDELIILRRTYFNQGETREMPDQFWRALYKDCRGNTEVVNDYQRFRLDRVNRIGDPRQRQIADRKSVV